MDRARLIPPIKASEVEQAVATLLELGLLQRDDKQRLRQSNPVVSTGAEVTQSLHVATYHRVMSEKAIQSIDRVKQSERDLSALTLTMSAAGLEKLKRKLQSFRRELIELSEAEAAPDQVLQLNFHCFPLTSIDLEKEKS